MNLFSKNKPSPEILVESWSPLCNIQAFAEESATCVYFYLWRDPNSDHPQVKSCWVCNTAPAPAEVDKAAMNAGNAPRMPRSGCAHDPGGIRLDPRSLSIVWLEEGDGAALLENGRILALIPGWVWNQNGFPGYARYAIGTTPFAWELTQAEPVLTPRVERSIAYWQTMEDGYWRPLQEGGLAAMEAFFGPHEKYFAIDGGKFPSRALVTGRQDGVRYAFTLGNAALCQPVVEQYHQEDAGDYRRMELAFAAREDFPEEDWMKVLGLFPGISGYPWQEITWLGHGHTLLLPPERLPGFAAFLLLDSRHLPDAAAPAFPPVMGEPVTLLWCVPITRAEYDLAVQTIEPVILEQYQGAPEELVIFNRKPKFLKE